MRRAILLCLGMILFLGACASKELSVKEPWARSGTTGGNSAVYMIIDNPTDEDEILLNATSDVADSVELHMSKMSEDNSMMMMQRKENIPIPSGASVELKPGGLHIMLIDLNHDLMAGETFSVALQFQNAGEIMIEVPIQNP
jgi:copper(I)-binding protein